MRHVELPTKQWQYVAVGGLATQLNSCETVATEVLIGVLWYPSLVNRQVCSTCSLHPALS